jgi:hypothetical protein
MDDVDEEFVDEEGPPLCNGSDDDDDDEVKDEAVQEVTRDEIVAILAPYLQALYGPQGALKPEQLEMFYVSMNSQRLDMMLIASYVSRGTRVSGPDSGCRLVLMVLVCP